MTPTVSYGTVHSKAAHRRRYAAAPASCDGLELTAQALWQQPANHAAKAFFDAAAKAAE